jgi:hypothetical protein
MSLESATAVDPVSAGHAIKPPAVSKELAKRRDVRLKGHYPVAAGAERLCDLASFRELLEQLGLTLG